MDTKIFYMAIVVALFCGLIFILVRNTESLTAIQSPPSLISSSPSLISSPSSLISSPSSPIGSGLSPIYSQPIAIPININVPSQQIYPKPLDLHAKSLELKKPEKKKQTKKCGLAITLCENLWDEHCKLFEDYVSKFFSSSQSSGDKGYLYIVDELMSNSQDIAELLSKCSPQTYNVLPFLKNRSSLLIRYCDAVKSGNASSKEDIKSQLISNDYNLVDSISKPLLLESTVLHNFLSKCLDSAVAFVDLHMHFNDTSKSSSIKDYCSNIKNMAAYLLSQISCDCKF